MLIDLLNEKDTGFIGIIGEDIEEAKRLGFKLLLVNVQLIDNWKFEVTSTELAFCT